MTDDGGKIVRLLVPDAKGEKIDVTVGFDSPAGWETTDAYFGAIIGRFGNRIAEGKFKLDGKDYQVPVNDKANSAALHDGNRGWDAYVWKAEPFTKGDDIKAGVDFRTMVFIGHKEVTQVPHEGGQNPFSYDITDFVKG